MDMETQSMTSGVKGSNLVTELTLMPSPCVGRAGEVWGACAGWAWTRDGISIEVG